MKKSNDIIGNRTRDLPVCSAVPQPTAPPRPPSIPLVETNFGHFEHYQDNATQNLIRLVTYRVH